MSDDTPTSGNRWETEQDPAAAAEPAFPTEGPKPDRKRALVAAAAAAVLLAGVGLGGFAIGRATADDHDGRFEQQIGRGQLPDGDMPQPPQGFPGEDQDGFQPGVPDSDSDSGVPESDSDSDDSPA